MIIFKNGLLRKSKAISTVIDVLRNVIIFLSKRLFVAQSDIVVFLIFLPVPLLGKVFRIMLREWTEALREFFRRSQPG